MSVHFQALKDQTTIELVPFIGTTIATGILTYAGQYAPRVVEFLSFKMANEALILGSVLTTFGGSLANVASRTFAHEHYKVQALQVFGYAVGAFAAAYFLPRIAAQCRMIVTFQNAMTLAIASTIANLVRIVLSSKRPSPTAETVSIDLKKLKDMAVDEFEKLANEVATGAKKLAGAAEQKYVENRIEIKKAGYEWDAKIYEGAHDKGTKIFSIEAYKKAFVKS